MAPITRNGASAGGATRRSTNKRRAHAAGQVRAKRKEGKRGMKTMNRRSGRPRGERASGPDLGTPEAQRKRFDLVGGAPPELAEYPLGVLLARGIITRDEHDAGCRYAHLRGKALGNATVFVMFRILFPSGGGRALDEEAQATVEGPVAGGGAGAAGGGPPGEGHGRQRRRLPAAAAMAETCARRRGGAAAARRAAGAGGAGHRFARACRPLSPRRETPGARGRPPNAADSDGSRVLTPLGGGATLGGERPGGASARMTPASVDKGLNLGYAADNHDI